jgi:predicted O-linked N-acetylglucosamine transferase (SPINDLY family)
MAASLLALDQQMHQALLHHHGGRLAEAEQIYRQILARRPDHADAMHMLGVLAAQVGRSAVAADLLQRAIALKPNCPEAYSNLGIALRDLGQLGQAVAACRQAIALKPNYPEAFYNLGTAFYADGQLEQAVAACRQAIALKPDYADASNGLGLALRGLGQVEQAVAAYRQAIAMRPDYPDPHNNLGVALRGLGQFEQAVAAYRQAITLRPNYPEAYTNLGAALRDLGQLEQAAAACRQAIALKPNCPDAHTHLGAILSDLGQMEDAAAACRKAIALRPHSPEAYASLGNALCGQGQWEPAIAAYRQAIAIKPHFPQAHGNLGAVLCSQGQFEQAIAAFSEAIALKPGSAGAYSSLGYALKESGRLEEAIAAYKQATELDPQDAAIHSDLVYALSFTETGDTHRRRQEAQEWDRRHALPLRATRPVFANVRDANKRLRIGYISPDFRQHPVGRFLLPVLEHHDHGSFEIACYSDVRAEDSITRNFQRFADLWRNTAGASDQAVAQQIRQDRIDILIDTTMHMAHNRLGVFARKPAPLQATWPAYPGTTGLATMDYRITDRHLDPPGKHDDHYSEKSACLPGCWCCYRPHAGAPKVSPLPACDRGHITFGCLNNFCKVNATTLRTWARLLRQLPQSRLILHVPEGNCRQIVCDLLAQEQVNPQRLQMVARLPMASYLKLHQAIDIALDPFPYSGGTTSCDALWMGVPVVTLAGNSAASRGTATLLHTLGLDQMVADSPDAYVRIATELASDLDRLQSLRLGLRPRIAASPLADAPRFAGEMEALYRAIWTAFVAGD